MKYLMAPIETPGLSHQVLGLWGRAMVRKNPNPANSHFGRGENRGRWDHRRYWLWQYAIWGAALVFALTAVTRGSAAQEQRTLVDYHIIHGAISEPLTDQPGDPERGRGIVLDREGGDCIICHAMPLPQRQFHGTIGPPLDGVGARYSAGELRLRLVDPKRLNPATIMPAYHRV